MPAPDGAERRNKIPLRVNRLLKVLNLLADFFELGLASDNALRNAGIICFRAEGIQFAKDFLGNELEGAPDRFVTAKMMRKLRQMTFDPGQFLRDIGSIGEKFKSVPNRVAAPMTQ